MEHYVCIIPLSETPSVPFRKFNLVSGEAALVCDNEVKALLAKGVIEEISESEAHFVCGIFVIPKLSGGFRMIVNLKPINRFIQQKHFKMKTLSLVRDLVRKGDFFAKLISLALTYLYLCVNKIVHTFNLLGVAYFTVFVPCVLGFPLHHGLSRNC